MRAGRDRSDHPIIRWLNVLTAVAMIGREAPIRPHGYGGTTAHRLGFFQKMSSYCTVASRDAVPKTGHVTCFKIEFRRQADTPVANSSSKNDTPFLAIFVVLFFEIMRHIPIQSCRLHQLQHPKNSILVVRLLKVVTEPAMKKKTSCLMIFIAGPSPDRSNFSPAVHTTRDE